ncbi:MAG: SDR family oxidoreductase [Clostridiales bacterium]|nr:SDR family oxidoreductase [Clostridiales bacterium]
MAVAWVTGASSGLGLHTARALCAAGWQVVGGARSLSAEEQPGLLHLPLDVTDDGSIAAFVREATARYGAPDALVNAAGVLLIGACEDYAAQELQRVMDVNFLGMARMVRAALPLMKERGRGRIVTFSSVNGLLATPFQGAYTASKHAVEGYSEALLMEVRPHGIQVMIVEPGDHRGGQEKYRGRSAHCSAGYLAARDRAAAVIARDEAAGSDPARLGNRVARALARRRMPARLRVAKPSQHMAVILHDLLPTGLFTLLLGTYYGVSRRK